MKIPLRGHCRGGVFLLFKLCNPIFNVFFIISAISYTETEIGQIFICKLNNNIV